MISFFGNPENKFHFLRFLTIIMTNLVLLFDQGSHLTLNIPNYSKYGNLKILTHVFVRNCPKTYISRPIYMIYSAGTKMIFL